ncbi:initiation factor 2B [Halobacteriales archaeon SW_10_68_16]|jgi:translation initiation factor eIF-2B subunit delta|nr:MAG: initiation factor 2B [Halobacteriales archaeon SW_10_68_16]
MIDETVAEIEQMQTQSSSVVAVKAAEALGSLAGEEVASLDEFSRLVEQHSRALQRAKRSHAPLYTSQQRIVEEVTESDAETVAEAKERLRTVVDEVVEEIESSKRRAGERAAELIEDGDTLLTHENSSTVMAAFEAALEAGTAFDVYVTEARPRFLGRRTARQLGPREGVDVTLIVDSAAGHFLPECDRVFLGMNCLVDDTVYNRIGTYPIAATADDVGVPVTVVGSSSKFIGSGFSFRNDYRPASEMMHEPVEGFEVANPGYDATPTRLLDSVVTEDAVMGF